VVRILLASLVPALVPLAADTVTPSIPPATERPWVGADLWANPAEDWLLDDGRVENRFSGGNRSLVVLSAELDAEPGGVIVSARGDRISFELRGEGYVGFEIGRRTADGDHRAAALRGAGLAAGIDFDGRPFIGRVDPDTAPLGDLPEKLQLVFDAQPVGTSYRGALIVRDSEGEELGRAEAEIHPSHLRGLVALMVTTRPPRALDPAQARPAELAPIATERGDEARFAFSEIQLAGDKVRARPERAWGPILWASHTLDNDGILRLLVQVAPLARDSRLEGTLELPGRQPLFAELEPNSRTLRFRVRRVPTDRDTPYKVSLAGDSYEGTLRAPPRGRATTIASLAGNPAEGFPHTRLTAAVAAAEPDLLVFHGEQITPATGGYGVVLDQQPNDRALQCFLRKWALHGWTWRETLRDTASIAIPDAADVFQQHLWGESGELADVSDGYGAAAENSGGYKMSPEFINAVHRCQTGSMPEPSDRAPCRSGISVYFTRLALGAVDLAVIADRQFKSAPARLFPRADFEDGRPQRLDWDPAADASDPEAELLGPRQQAFLRQWARDPAAGTRFRAAASHSPWLGLRSIDNANGERPVDHFGSNGWPPAKRDLALDHLAAAGAIHLCGSGPASAGRYRPQGPWWFSGPPTRRDAAARWQVPNDQGRPGPGSFEDAFGTRFQLDALADPDATAPGFMLSRWDPARGRVRIECLSTAEEASFDDWPLVLDADGKRRLD